MPQRPTARFADSAESQLFLLTRVRSIARAARAMLERYLLPVSPIVYAAMVAGWSAVPGSWRALGPLALIAGVAVCNFWNPPYPFPFENNLGFTEFVKPHQTAAGYVEQNYAGAEVSTAWPLSAALARLELGYVKGAHRVREIRDFGESAVASLDRDSVEVFVLYSRQWDPPGNLLRNPIITKIWRRFFSYDPQIGSFDLDTALHLRTVAGWSHGGQWIEIHARY